MPAKSKERVTGAELEAVGGYAIFGVVLGNVQRRLEPVEPEPDKRAVNDTITHIVELGTQQPENDQYAERLCDLFRDRRRDRGCQQQSGVRSQDLRYQRVLPDPHVREQEKCRVEGHAEPRGNTSAPEEGRS